MIIAIDGPSASGKSTLGRLLARALNLLYIDTGSMYRAVALAVIEAHLDPRDTAAVTVLANEIEIDLKGDPDSLSVLLDGREVVNYRSAEDLIRKTPDYYQHVARKRIDHKLGSVDRYAAAHFDGTDPYQSAIAHTMLFLRQVLDKDDLTRLRRACYSLSARPRTAPEDTPRDEVRRTS